jgi:hypothetical protein
MITLTTENLVSIIWDGSRFVAVTELGSILTSSDADVWSQVTAKVGASGKSPSISNPVTSIAYANGIYVVSSLGGHMYSSTNLSTWTYSVITNFDDKELVEGMTSVTSNGSKFVAVGKDNCRGDIGIFGIVAYSTDGVNWIKNHSYEHLLRVKWINNLFYAVGVNGMRWYSPDGTTWTQDFRQSSNDFRTIAWTGIRYFCSDVAIDMMWVNNRLLGLTQNGIATSKDGGVWEIKKETEAGVLYIDPAIGINKYGSMTTDGTKIVVVGGKGFVWVSYDDGENWSQTGSKFLKPTITIIPLTTETIFYNKITPSATISSDGGATVTERGFVVCEGSDIPDIGDLKFVSGSGTGSYSYTDDMNLTPVEEYSVRAYAINDAGVGYSDQLTFTTKADVPHIEIGTITLPGTNGFTISANVTSNGGAMVTERGFVYDRTHMPTLVDQNIICGSDIGSFTGIITGLLNNSTYIVRGYATNSSGTGYTEPLTFDTLNTLRGTPIQSSNRVYVLERELDNNVVKITLIGYMADETHAPKRVMNLLDEEGNPRLKWEIEDETIIKIENEAVVPLANGQSHITATYKRRDGDMVTVTGLVIVGDIGLDRLSISEPYLNVILGQQIDIIPK